MFCPSFQVALSMPSGGPAGVGVADAFSAGAGVGVVSSAIEEI